MAATAAPTKCSSFPTPTAQKISSQQEDASARSVVTFLASGGAAFVSGRALVADGGFTIAPLGEALCRPKRHQQPYRNFVCRNRQTATNNRGRPRIRALKGCRSRACQ